VRLSLQETVGDLENKDLQLTLAMQDLTIATDEIRMVARLRSQLDNMERERQENMEKLNKLEDESAAVKVSLIQLLQEKSATNKTLALENWRLRQAVSELLQQLDLSSHLLMSLCEVICINPTHAVYIIHTFMRI
jgi:predicted nuclease with TOPRIM domain